jgi:hypothetical protein
MTSPRIPGAMAYLMGAGIAPEDDDGNATDAACFFGVDERTARGWLEGVTAPRGQVVAYSIATMPEQSREFLAGAA